LTNIGKKGITITKGERKRTCPISDGYNIKFYSQTRGGNYP